MGGPPVKAVIILRWPKLMPKASMARAYQPKSKYEMRFIDSEQHKCSFLLRETDMHRVAENLKQNT